MLIRQTLLYFPAQLIGPLFQFIAAVAWTHFLPPESYGVLTFILAAQDLAFVVSLNFWSAYTVRYLGAVAGGPDLARHQATENAVLIASAVLQAIAAVIAVRSINADLSAPLITGATLFIITRSLSVHFAERARAVGDIATYTIMQLLGPVAGFWLAVALVAQVSPTPAAALWGFTIVQALGLAWAWRSMGLRLANGAPDRAIFLKALGFGLPIVIGGALGWVSLNGIRVVVEHAQGVAAVGLIAVGWGLGQRLASVSAMLVAAAAFPLAVKTFQTGARQDALRQLADNGALLLGVVMPASIGVIILAEPAVALMIAEPFRAVTLAVLPTAALAGAVRNFRLHFADQVFLLVERPYVTVIINIVEAVAVVICCGIGVAAGGLSGASLGCLVGSSIATLFCVVLARVQCGLPLPVMHALRIGAATGVMWAVLKIPAWSVLLPSAAAQVAVEPLIGALAYVGVLALFYRGSLGGVLAQRRALRPLAET